jgi:hypothetical protein
MALESHAPSTKRLPLWFKLAYSAFMAVLVPVYWHYYGPTNFLMWLIGLMIGIPLLLCAPVHLLLSRLAPRAPQ